MKATAKKTVVVTLSMTLDEAEVLMAALPVSVGDAEVRAVLRIGASEPEDTIDDTMRTLVEIAASLSDALNDPSA